MTHIIIVNGYPRSGKDTLIAEMIRLLRSRSAFGDNYSMITATKAMLKLHRQIQIDWLETKSPEARGLLADVHQALLKHTSAPIDDLIAYVSTRRPDVLFTCCREPETIARIKEACGHQHYACTTLLVQRDDHEEPATEADRNVMNYAYDVIVSNNSPLSFMPYLASEVLHEIGLIPRPDLTLVGLTHVTSTTNQDPAA